VAGKFVMRTLVVGLGIQGTKRKAVAGADVVATVDPVKSEAQYQRVEEIPLNSYDSALVCTPDGVKLDILKYLLSNQKHVLVEKPLFADSENDISDLKKLAEKNKVTCYTAYNHRFEPHIATLKNILKSGELGKVHLTRIFYGNGTAREVKNSAWRDQGMGVLADIGSHLLDMILFLFENQDFKFTPLALRNLENKSFDYVSFGTASGVPHLLLEATLLSWKNTFNLDVIAENGSAHISCLCKWGPSTLSVRKRVLPSGRPVERNEVLECRDPTWQLEYEHFLKLCETGGNNLSHDIWINNTLNNIFHKQADK